MAVGNEGFEERKEKKNAVCEIDVDHQAGNQGEQNPLEEGPRTARAIPIPEKKSHRKDGVRVRPCGIEIHVNRERAGAPNSQRGEKGPARFHVLPGQRVGKKQAQKTVNSGADGHGQEVRKREAVRRNVRAQSVAKQHNAVGREEKGRPEKGRSDGKQVAYVTSLCVLGREELAAGQRAGLGKEKIRTAPVFFEMKIVLNQRSAGVGVVANAVTMNNRIYQGKRKEKKKEQDFSEPRRIVHPGCGGGTLKAA